MTETNTRFDGSIPEMYDRHPGPLLFEPYAADIAGRVARLRPRKVLEIAAGTGIVSRMLIDALPRETALTGQRSERPNAGICAAENRVGLNAIWNGAKRMRRTCHFADESFDVVVCQFGLMFVPDKLKALREFLRVLDKRGSLILSVWDSIDRNPVQLIAHSTIGKFFETDPPDSYQIPCGMGDVKEVRRLVEESGFEEIQIETLSLTGNSESSQSTATGLVKGNPVINMIRERGTADVDGIIRAVASAMEKRFGAESLQVPLRAHVISAVKP